MNVLLDPLVFWTITGPTLISIGFMAGLAWRSRRPFKAGGVIVGLEPHEAMLSLRDPAKTPKHHATRCFIVITGDRSTCRSCGLKWDTNDRDPPACIRKVRA